MKRERMDDACRLGSSPGSILLSGPFLQKSWHSAKSRGLQSQASQEKGSKHQKFFEILVGEASQGLGSAFRICPASAQMCEEPGSPDSPACQASRQQSPHSLLSHIALDSSSEPPAGSVSLSQRARHDRNLPLKSRLSPRSANGDHLGQGRFLAQSFVPLQTN